MITDRNLFRKRFFITGGAGFIGSHLVDFLLEREHTVFSIDNLSTGNLNNLSKSIKSPKHTLFTKGIESFPWQDHLRKGDIIIHLAATVGVTKVSENSWNTSRNNLYTTQLLLDACRDFDCRLIYASTSEVYGENCGSCSEHDALNVYSHHGGRSAYTLSKLYGEFLCFTYAEEFNVPVSILRFFNTIGPRQSHLFGMVVPQFINQALRNKPITVFDDGLQTRSFCDVSDITTGIYAVCQHCPGTEIYNLGNDQPTTIMELAEYIRTVTNSRSEIILKPFPPERAYKSEIKHRKPNLQKAEKTLKWKPYVSWKDSIQNIIDHSYSEFLVAQSKPNAI